MQASLNDLQARQVLRRLWDQDPGLWSADPATQRAIRNRLGWLRICRAMAPKTAGLRGLAEQLRGEGFTRAVLLGMGGSGLFPEVCRATFGVRPGALDLTVLDTTDPTAIRAEERRAPLKELLVIVSSKSGSTAEIAALSKHFYHAFQTLKGDPGAHCLVVTDAGTPLEAQAKAWKCRQLFVHGPGTGAEVGGRFSALTYFGLLPAALIGADVDALLARAEEMLQRCAPDRPIEGNPAAQLGAALAVLARSGRDKLTILCAPQLSAFGTWVEQLVAESTGKQGKGIIPVHGEPLRPPDGYGSDRIFVELQLAGRVDATLERQARGLAAAGHPVISIRWRDPYDLGGEAVKWFIATVIAGALLEINPFDEPDVQASKDRTNALLERYAQARRLPDDAPALCADADIALYGARPSGSVGSLPDGLRRFFSLRRAGDYLALLSFLPRTTTLDRAVRALRERVGERLGIPTVLGFGPRYLHSTGQLFKGGPDTGLFLLLTAEEPEDLPIPGEAFTFGVLKQAQALGDFQAMQEKGRRILRVHLRGDPEPAMRRLLQASEEAIQINARSHAG